MSSLPLFPTAVIGAYPGNPASSEVVEVALSSLREIGKSWEA